MLGLKLKKPKPLRCRFCFTPECDVCDYALEWLEVVELPTAADVDKFIEENPKGIVI